jgi:hypothetical protein
MSKAPLSRDPREYVVAGGTYCRRAATFLLSNIEILAEEVSAELTSESILGCPIYPLFSRAFRQ